MVFTKSEAIEVLNNLKGTHWLVGMLLYGSGLRLTESLESRVKDIDFGYNQIIVRDSKGEKDRSTMLLNKIIRIGSHGEQSLPFPLVHLILCWTRTEILNAEMHVLPRTSIK